MTAVADIQTGTPRLAAGSRSGATVTATGAHLAVASEVADGVTLCVFGQAGAETPMSRCTFLDANLQNRDRVDW
jgi:hypothetical protein